MSLSSGVRKLVHRCLCREQRSDRLRFPLTLFNDAAMLWSHNTPRVGGQGGVELLCLAAGSNLEMEGGDRREGLDNQWASQMPAGQEMRNYNWPSKSEVKGRTRWLPL